MKVEIEIDEVESCECIGTFDDEYVYDIEVDDETSHTFFGNGILVHNSNYICFEEILSKCDWNGTAKEFILKLYKVFLGEYLANCYKIYSKKTNTTNVQKFELEAISDSGIWLAKKKYVYNPIWKDPGIDIESLSHITAKGVELAQSSSSRFAREVLTRLIQHILTKKRKFNMSEFAKIVKKYKDEFKLTSIEDISKSSSIGDYEKFILQDKEKIVIEKSCPIHVRAAAVYNNALYNSKYKKKYEPIRTGEKVKYYHVKTKDEQKNIFAFISGSYPIEFAPPIDYDIQFAKDVIEPINRFIEAMGFSPMSSSLLITTQLF